jgi:WD40 repeat protein
MSERPLRRQIPHDGAESQRRSWKCLAFGLVLALTVLGCSVTGALPTATAAPTVTATLEPPTSTSAPPTSTPLPPTPTEAPDVITADNVAGLSAFTYFAEGELVRSLAFSPDGTVLAAAVGDPAATIGTIELFDTASGQPLRTLEGHTLAVWGLIFSPDGRFLASAGRDHSARIWDWRNGTLVQSLDLPNEVVAVEFSPDSRILAVGGVDQWPNADIWTYQVDSWTPLLRLAEYWNIPDIAFSPDGTRLVGGGTSRNVRVWRASDGAEQLVLYHSHQVGGIAISPDGSTVAAATCQQSTDNSRCTDGAIWLWDLATGRRITELTGFPEGVVDVEFSHDGSMVIGGSRDGTLRAYSMSDYKLLLALTSSVGGSPAAVIAMAISSDGRFLATAGNGRINLWRVEP